jgi:DNA-binding CsgD family transcriptional regulator
VGQGRVYGRERECRQIDACLASAQAGRFAAVGVEGEPGAGKTALCGYAAETAAGFRIVRAAAAEMESGLPLSGLSMVVRPLLSLVSGLADPQRLVLEGLCGRGGLPVDDRFALGVAVLGALSIAAEQQPLLVIFDDLQWLDVVSADALGFALRRLDADAVGVVVAGRPGSISVLDQGAAVSLGGLDPDSAARLAADRGPDMAPAVVEALVAGTGGNPLALVEAVARLTLAQRQGTAPLPEPLPIGNRLLELYRAQLAHLPADCQLALAILSAAGTAGHLVGAALSGYRLGLDVLEPAETEGLVVQQADGFGFRHPLICQAAVDLLAPAERRRVHEALAELSTTDLDRYAIHLASAAPGPSERVAQALLAAAEDAELRGGLTAAAGILERAALATPPGEVRLQRLKTAAQAQLQAGQIEVAVGHLDEVVRTTNDRLLRADAALSRTGALLWGPDGLQAAMAARREGARVAEVDPGRASLALAQAAVGMMSQGELAAAVELSQDAYRLGGSTLPDALYGFSIYSWALATVGRRNEAFALLDSVAMDTYIEWCQRTDPVPGSQTMAYIGHAYERGERWHDAHRILEATADNYRTRSAPHSLAFPAGVMADNLWWLDRWPEAASLADEGMTLALQTGQPILSHYDATILGRIRAAQGRDEEARQLIDAASGMAGAAGIRPLRMYALQALGFLELGARRPGEAARALQEADRIAEQLNYQDLITVPYSADLIEALIRDGQREAAESALSRHRHKAQSLGSPWGMATAARYEAMLVGADSRRGQDADLLFKEAVGLHPAGSFEDGRTRLCWGEQLRRRREGHRAQQHLERAVAVFDALGAQPWAHHARAELASLGVQIEQPKPSGLHELTAREAQIAIAVARGATNRQAAAALFVSPKTVEYHLGHVYQKLNVTSRTQLASLIAGAVAQDRAH